MSVPLPRIQAASASRLLDDSIAQIETTGLLVAEYVILEPGGSESSGGNQKENTAGAASTDGKGLTHANSSSRR